MWALFAASKALQRAATFEAPSEVGQHKDFVERFNPEVQMKDMMENIGRQA